VTYPSDLDEYEKVNEGRHIPDGMVEIDYWDGEDKEVLIPLKKYLELLHEHLVNL